MTTIADVKKWTEDTNLRLLNLSQQVQTIIDLAEQADAMPAAFLDSLKASLENHGHPDVVGDT